MKRTEERGEVKDRETKRTEYEETWIGPLQPGQERREGSRKATRRDDVGEEGTGG